MRYLLLLLAALFLARECRSQEIADTSVKRNIQMKEVIVKSRGYDYKKDSAEHQAIYHKAFNTANQHTQVNFGGPGIAVNGLFSDLAYAINGKKRKAKEFTKLVLANEQEHIVQDSRYTPGLTRNVTRLTGDTLAHFMNAYPIEVSYVQSASELELMMWIRENYKDWVSKGRPMPNVAPDSLSAHQVR